MINATIVLLKEGMVPAKRTKKNHKAESLKDALSMAASDASDQGSYMHRCVLPPNLPSPPFHYAPSFIHS